MKERPIIFDEHSVRSILVGTKTQTRRVLKESARPNYGQPADRLWVRESWGSSHMQYMPNLSCWYYADGEPPFATGPAWRKRSPIHMPRWASRITLEITDVRVQRVQDISDEDAKSEGVTLPENTVTHYEGMWRDAFWWRWDRLNAERGYPWQSNPWVWAITFQVMQQEEKQ